MRHQLVVLGSAIRVCILIELLNGNFISIRELSHCIGFDYSNVLYHARDLEGFGLLMMSCHGLRHRPQLTEAGRNFAEGLARLLTAESEFKGAHI